MDILLQTIRSGRFQKLFDNTVTDIRHNRRVALSNARSKNQSARLLSDPFGRLDENGFMSYAFMSNEYLLILMRKSNLPAMERKCISDFMTSLFIQTIQSLQKEKELIPAEIPVKTNKVNKPKKIKKWNYLNFHQK